MALIPSPKAALASFGPQRQTVNLALNGTTGTVTLPASFVLLRVGASVQGRFRLYRDAASRDADFNRALGQDLEAAHGLLLETVHTSTRLDLPLSPLVAGAALVKGDPYAWAWDGAPGASLSFDLLTLENA